MSLRPVLYAIDQDNIAGCGAQSCVKAVMLVGTPAMWFIAVPILVWAAWKSFVKRDWRYAVALTGYCAGFLPWFADIDRQMYFFYATPLAPFLIIGITLVLGDVLGRAGVGVERRLTSVAVVAIYVGLVVANFIWLWPILNGDAISSTRLTMEIWLPSWG
jgi:dolichyl-phosphate-mannose--protein O-mannosyl transferase